MNTEYDGFRNLSENRHTALLMDRDDSPGAVLFATIKAGGKKNTELITNNNTGESKSKETRTTARTPGSMPDRYLLPDILMGNHQMTNKKDQQ